MTGVERVTVGEIIEQLKRSGEEIDTDESLVGSCALNDKPTGRISG